MSNLLSRVGLVSALTMLSRVLGLARDMLTSAVFGATVWNSAFITAFTLPNLFRRLLGEGALTAALMPNLSEELERNGRGAVHTLVNKTLSWLLVVCSAISVVAIVCFAIVESLDVPYKWILGAEIAQVLFPYVVLICLAAIISAALNLFGKFGIPAMTAIWLNCSILIMLGGSGILFADTMRDRMIALCLGVMIGGGLQLLVPAIALLKEGWRPRFDFQVSPRLKEVMLLTVPGIMGAAVFQINVMVSRGLAFFVNDSGATLLYLSNRLVELPIGVFAIAVATVVFPALSRAAAKDDKEDFGRSFRDGISLSLMMAFPAAGGLIVLGGDIIATLFQRGMFDAADTLAMTPVVTIFALGTPFYAFVSIETRAFFSLKDTRTPVQVAAIALAVNFVLSLLLIKPWGIEGLAVASNVAVAFQAIFLHWRLRDKIPDTRLGMITMDLLKIVIGTVIMSFVIWGAWTVVQAQLGNPRLAAYVSVFGLIPLGVVVYFILLKLMRVSAVDGLTSMLRRK